MINIDYSSRDAIYIQIIKEIEKYVVLGILKPGDRIPSIRECASDIGINPNTVKKAYDILEENGVIMTVSTKGTFISDNVKEIYDNKINNNYEEIFKLCNELLMFGISKEEIINKLKEL